MNLRELFPVFPSCKSLCKEATVFQRLGLVIFWPSVDDRTLPVCDEYPVTLARCASVLVQQQGGSWVGSRGAVFCVGSFLQQELCEWTLAKLILNSTMAVEWVCSSGILLVYHILNVFIRRLFQFVFWAPHINYVPWRPLKLSLAPSIIPQFTIT